MHYAIHFLDGAIYLSVLRKQEIAAICLDWALKTVNLKSMFVGRIEPKVVVSVIITSLFTWKSVIINIMCLDDIKYEGLLMTVVTFWKPLGHSLTR